MLASMEGIAGEGVVVEDRGESYAVLSKRWGIEDEGLEDQVSIESKDVSEHRPSVRADPLSLDDSRT